MTTWIKAKRIMARYLSEMRWYVIVSFTLAYAVSSYLLLYAVGEYDLLATHNFAYWLVVTGSTVGYGDMSPTTEAGKWAVALYIIPVGLSIFALLLGRIANWVGNQWQKGAKGLNALNVENHVLLIGWNGKRTMQLLKLLLIEKASASNNPDIVLCVRADIENPMPSKIDFVKVHSFNNDDDMDRACIDKAATIIIDNPQDDMTMTTALYCSKRNQKAHKVAYFDDESLVPLLQKHCPEIECTPSVAVEMLAKSAFDPGSSLLHHDLLDVYEGQAQFSATIPEATQDLKVETVFLALKKRYNATFIGYVEHSDFHNIIVNPPLTDELHAGAKVFYIADKRINDIAWQSFADSSEEI
ncbi:potassium channel family protein [Glaciecola siphonariae]|uniref:Potassium channel family protein n=1 Tax=Glaciecola siphonariae TaxID=521012 RepID=A0ABV9M1C1_9ALTE